MILWHLQVFDFHPLPAATAGCLLLLCRMTIGHFFWLYFCTLGFGILLPHCFRRVSAQHFFGLAEPPYVVSLGSDKAGFFSHMWQVFFAVWHVWPGVRSVFSVLLVGGLPRPLDLTQPMKGTTAIECQGRCRRDSRAGPDRCTRHRLWKWSRAFFLITCPIMFLLLSTGMLSDNEHTMNFLTISYWTRAPMDHQSRHA